MSVRTAVERWSLAIAFVAAFAFFAVKRPHVFLTWANARAILDDASVLTVLAVGVTLILVIGEFDLSVGFVVGLAAAAAVAAMAFRGWPWWAAVLFALLAGGVTGLANGVSVAVLRIPSFIGTLAIGSVASGAQAVVAQTSVFQGIS